ncbi:hypothetical protein E1B28_006846 [Marasmius oreades]|uniref:Uncharacterized protein n=1 Tax=Marasmius oreades TaxID=181124 RepID=A0A9P7UWY9_9AGAR|nr:uncharacterized protein E1B28_006846 [Marasmius oreades]KAG7096173.1 hypothetical protein E1B28_006846 [Marasmius oreades]
MLKTGFDYEGSEIILKVMDGAPANWSTMLTTQSYGTAEDLQTAMRYHEETLMDLDRERPRFSNQRDDSDHTFKPAYVPWSYLVGTCTDLPPPQFPKDDSNISKKTTPKAKGARPCHHCGSELHWDKECKYSKRTACVRLCEISVDDLEAQDEYEELFDNLSDNKTLQDFDSALQSSKSSNLEGCSTNQPDSETQTYHVTATSHEATIFKATMPPFKQPLNRQTHC